MTQANFLIVDDDPELLDFLDHNIQRNGHHAIRANNGSEAYAMLLQPEFKVSAVISDVVMPEMDGYELCRKVRGLDSVKNIPFVFISVKTHLEEIQKGYEVGGDDYITKPLQADEVLMKTSNILKYKHEQAQLSNSLKDSQQIALNAMSYSGNLGGVLTFLQDALDIEDFANLAKHIFTFTRELGLFCSLQFYTSQGAVDFADTGKVSPLESNIMELARKKGRFFDFGPRTIVNYKDFALLIKNMPIDEPDKYGMIKDILGNLANAIEIKVKQLLSSSRLNRKNELISVINEMIDEVDKTFNFVQQESVAAIDDLIVDLEAAMITLGLTEAQEEKINTIANECRGRTEVNFRKAQAIEEKFRDIHATLESILR
jgi:CheY-like chemotaxis protein